MGPIGIPEMMAIFMIALLLFGPKKLPELGRTLGKALSEFRRAKNELKSTFESHMQELEREARLDSQPKYIPPATDYSSVSYPYAYDENGPSEPPVGYESHSDSEVKSEHASLPPAVEGAVARSNGVHSVSTTTAAAEEEHPA